MWWWLSVTPSSGPVHVRDMLSLVANGKPPLLGTPYTDEVSSWLREAASERGGLVAFLKVPTFPIQNSRAPGLEP